MPDYASLGIFTAPAAGDPTPCELALGEHLQMLTDNEMRERQAPATGVPLYTLDEARAEMARQVCGSVGHDLEIVIQGVSGEPVAVVCGRPCGLPAYRARAMGEVDPLTLLSSAVVDLWEDLERAYAASAQVPAETSIECAGLITRIVDITRCLGAPPAAMIPPALLVAGLYESVHAAAGLEVSVPPCLLDDAVTVVNARAAGCEAAGA